LKIRSFIAVVLLFVCVTFYAPSSRAQAIGFALGNRVPFARAGVFGGRTGQATGASGYIEINPVWPIGFCAIASQSGAISEQDGGTASGWDLSIGGCMIAHTPEVKGFLISPFVQMTYTREHGRFALPLGDGIYYREAQDSIRELLVAGVTVDREIVRGGPRWALRIGKNFGAGPAVDHFAGLFLAGGLIFPLDHPVALGRSFMRMVGLKPH
jgi:hypothetical protein